MRDPLWIMLTVDLENMNTPLAEGKYDQTLFTIGVVEPLLKIFEKLKVKAVFFASVFEYCRFNKNAVREVLQYIDSMGHDVQLHTHPYWCYGREHMWQYSLQEQIDIIDHGRELLKEWLGKYPVGHRAGAYGINQDTLQALKKNNIPIDSSMFYKHDNCRITWSRNRIAEKDGTVELPVTGFYRKKVLDFILFNIRYHKAFIKTDIDWCNLDDLLSFVDAAKKHDIKFMNLFMHSYSLLRTDDTFSFFQEDKNAKEKLERFLEKCISDNNVRFLSLSKFWEKYQASPELFRASDYVPTFTQKINVWKKIVEKYLARIRKFAQ